ncbi:MAG: phosphoglycerate mutase (2,3-diphosphoglycerate-independent) [Moraxellaceae bacterium]|nr:MAG: phosphoglycerate mutase (2,3-diphosphoglycerate-independent) [Moraxellaceae bacterium]
MTNSTKRKPHVLVILDGWGHRETEDNNAIAQAQTPCWDSLWSNRPHTLISSSGMDVGLPDGQMGNSEVGHMNLGAGRVVYQNFTLITKAIETGDFFNNQALCEAVDKAVAADKAVHLMGLLSPGGVHSHQGHIQAMIDMAVKRGAKQVYVHAFLDGRDTPPRSAETSIDTIDQQLRSLNVGRIASIIGRYYAMDRDNRWDRVEAAYNMLTTGAAEYSAPSAAEGLALAYKNDLSDEFVKPTIIAAEGETPASIEDDDAVIFMNFRADRAREITRSFVSDDFSDFTRTKRPALSSFVMLTHYADDIDAPCAFPPRPLANVYGEYLSNQGKTQLRIAETEKYAHVTFFFSGGREALFEGEERKLIKSPDVATYDLQPEMSAPEVTDELVKAITNGQYDAIVCNFANGDMVGHTGVLSAAIKAVEALDACLEKVVAAVEAVDGHMLITADHGNCEQMADASTGQPHTAHTCELVPLVYIGNRELSLQQKGGTLSDIAPTLLKLMDLPQPEEMTGTALI